MFRFVQYDTSFEGEFFGVHDAQGAGVHPPLLQLRGGHGETAHIMRNEHVFPVGTQRDPAQRVASVGQLDVLDLLETPQVDHGDVGGHIVQVGPLGRQEIGYEKVFPVFGHDGSFRLAQYLYGTEHDAALGIDFGYGIGELVEHVNFRPVLRHERRGGSRSDRDGAFHATRSQVDNVEGASFLERGHVYFFAAARRPGGYAGGRLFENPFLDGRSEVVRSVNPHGFVAFIGGDDTTVGKDRYVGREQRGVLRGGGSRLRRSCKRGMRRGDHFPASHTAGQDDSAGKAGT